MSRIIKEKKVQEQHECVCGRNNVFHSHIPMKWKDMLRFGMKRKKDKSTGVWFWLRYIYYEKCYCNDEDIDY
jgi:hypothetical protein